MAKKELKLNDMYVSDIVTEYTGPTHYLEEDIYVPEELVQNKSLIRMEMNIIQYPLFSKNAKRLKNEVTTYFFNKNRDTYIKVTPASGELVPGEAEERTFIALMKIMKERGMPKTFLVTPQELKEASKNTSNNYTSELKRALERLASTNYVFKNTLYSNEKKEIIKVETNTNILGYKLIELNRPQNKEYRARYEDNRVKEVYEIIISEPFYQNIIRRGYLAFDSDLLLSISSTVARTLYMMLEKVRYSNLYVKESVYVLIKKIPLKFEKKHMSETIKTLRKALEELKKKGLIKDFNFIKESTWERSELEIFFDESHNILKEERFMQDDEETRTVYDHLEISFTEKNIQDTKPLVRPTEEMVLELMGILPAVARNLKSMKKTLTTSLEKYGYEKVKKAVIYLKRQSKLKSPRSFFLKTLENNWAADIEIHSEQFKKYQEELKSKGSEQLKIVDIPTDEKYKKEIEYFSSLSQEEQMEIEKEAYDDYIKRCGANGKIQEMAFKAGKKAIISEYLQRKLSVKADSKQKKIEETKQETKTIKENKSKKENKENYESKDKDSNKIYDVKKSKELIEKSLEFASLINNYTPEEKLNIFKEILNEVILVVGVDSLTKEKLQEVIKKYIKIL